MTKKNKVPAKHFTEKEYLRAVEQLIGGVTKEKYLRAVAWLIFGDKDCQKYQQKYILNVLTVHVWEMRRKIFMKGTHVTQTL